MAKATAAAKKVAPFFASLTEKVYAEDITSWTFYEYVEVKGKERRVVFKMDRLDDPDWEPDPFTFDDNEMQRVFPEGDYEVEVRNEEGQFITRRRLAIGNPDAGDNDPAAPTEPDTSGDVQVIDNDSGKIIAVKGLSPTDQAGSIAAQREAIEARKRAEREREALEEERKALREKMLNPARAGSEIETLLREQVAHLREDKARLESTLREEKSKIESTLRDEKTNAVQTLREDHQKEIARRDTLEITLRTEHSKALLDLEARLRNEFRLEREAFDTKLKAAEQRADDQHKRVMELERQLLDEIRKADTDNLRLNQNLLTVDAKREAAEAAAKAKQSGDSAGKIEMMREAINGVKEAAKIAKDLGAGPDMEKKILEAVEKALKGKALGNGAAG